MLLFNGNLVSHCLNRCGLILTAEGHKNCACADCGVESLGKTATRADVKVVGSFLHVVNKCAFNILLVALGSNGSNVNVLFSTVGI